MKEYFKGIPFTPYTTGFMFKNWYTRVFERVPKSMLTYDLRLREKISVNETKAALERKFDVKKTVLDTAEEERIRKHNELKAKRQEFFKREILPQPISRKFEIEKRVEISDEEENLSSSEEMGDIDENSESVYSKIKSRKYDNLKFKNPSSELYDHEAHIINRKSLEEASSSSFLDTNKHQASVPLTFHNTKAFSKGFEQSEIGKQGGDSDVTSTLRGAFNQVSSIVEAQEFRFGKRLKKKEQSENVEEKNK